MDYITLLKLNVDDHKLLSKFKYTFKNQTRKININGIFDSNGCTPKYDVDFLDVTYFDLFLNNICVMNVRTYPQEKSKAMYNKSQCWFKTTSGTTSPNTQQKDVPLNKKGCRKLTKNEINLAEIIFKGSIDYSKVIVHKHGTPLFLGFQNKDTAVTPNGEIYFKKIRFKEDFAVDKSFIERHWIVHELVHVWQYQLGFSVIGHALDRVYDYDLKGKNDISEFYMEQQGDIIADYCMYLAGYSTEGLRQLQLTNKQPLDFLLRYQNECNRTGRNDLPNHQRVLARFLSNPKNEDLLPKV